MIICNKNTFYVGLKVIQNGEPCVIIDNECIKPGKGQSFNRVRLKKIVSGKIFSKTFKSGEYLEIADIMEVNLVYVYRDREDWYFMYDKSFEQVVVQDSVIGKHKKWLIEQLYYSVTFWNNIPILVTPPHFIDVIVINTTPVIKGSNNSVSSGMKLAHINTGIIVKVPIFIQIGERIKVNTRSGEYISRSR